MVSCTVRDWQGKEAGQAEFEVKVASEETAAGLVHRALTRQMANQRQGTASSKTRSEVRGGGRKPWRQKGTGRARAGSIRSPLWRGGGVIFGPKPRDYSVQMNRKERRLALTTALSSRAESLIVVEDFSAQLSRPKTKEIIAALGRWGVAPEAKTLLIVSEKHETLYLSVRNIENVKLLLADQLNIYDLLAADSIVVTQSAIAKIQEVYGG
ncbi:50S ribosomal protein L4 [Lyngbya confervoides]|uniref:Large ribosomal subunit protein uL4 n=1 Tax=Lyngbya confervoides BDU141951 TaxID=1574623 RepID=A0ABD4TAD1_9CYAN|nr:50S ribosomal protein L4 [Lyngbya confervoides]MCM1985305.1 50S ribosomal protein L4 [Lyngbya confervoides BDU141951]